MTWETYQLVTLCGFGGGIIAMLIALYKGWGTFKNYPTQDIVFGLCAATAIWLAFAVTWPVSLPGILIYKLYLWWEHRDGSHLAGDR
jgi:hypothetical protein